MAYMYGPGFRLLNDLLGYNHEDDDDMPNMDAEFDEAKRKNEAFINKQLIPQPPTTTSPVPKTLVERRRLEGQLPSAYVALEPYVRDIPAQMHGVITWLQELYTTSTPEQREIIKDYIYSAYNTTTTAYEYLSQIMENYQESKRQALRDEEKLFIEYEKQARIDAETVERQLKKRADEKEKRARADARQAEAEVMRQKADQARANAEREKTAQNTKKAKEAEAKAIRAEKERDKARADAKKAKEASDKTNTEAKEAKTKAERLKAEADAMKNRTSTKDEILEKLRLRALEERARMPAGLSPLPVDPLTKMLRMKMKNEALMISRNVDMGQRMINARAIRQNNLDIRHEYTKQGDINYANNMTDMIARNADKMRTERALIAVKRTGGGLIYPINKMSTDMSTGTS